MQLGIEEVVSLSLSENLHARTFVRNVRLNLELSASLRLRDGNCEFEIGSPVSLSSEVMQGLRFCLKSEEG